MCMIEDFRIMFMLVARVHETYEIVFNRRTSYDPFALMHYVTQYVILNCE